MIKLDRRLLIEIAALIAVLAAGTYALHAFGLMDLFTSREQLVAFIQEHRRNAVLTFIGLQAAQVIAAPLPGEVTGFAGGILFGAFWGIIYSTIGLTIGSWLAFNLSRLIGRPLVEIVARPETIARYDYVMTHKGLFFAFLLFLIPGFPKDILCYLLGLGHMSQRNFLLVSTSGRLLGTTLLTLGGSLFRDEHYGAFFTLAGISIGIILIAMIYRQDIERWFRKARVKARGRRRRTKRNGRPGDAGGNMQRRTDGD